MSIERTLSIIKPDCTKKNVVGKIISIFEENGLRPIALKKAQLNRSQAGMFYEVHKHRPFYNELIEYMVSGPVVIQVLEGENAIQKNRDLMGHTNPQLAEPNTIRQLFGDSIEANAVHGSDGPETAKNEISFFFSKEELVG